MLNESPLNATILGASQAQPWTLLAASRVFAMAGTCRMSVQKVLKSSQSFVLDGAAKLPVSVAIAGQQVFRMACTAVLHVLRPVPMKATQLITLAGTSRLYAEVMMPAVQAFKLTYQAAMRRLTAQHFTAEQSLRMTTQAVINDIYIGPAPDERVTGAVEIKTQATASVNAGGQ